jgi:hypothetical protein
MTTPDAPREITVEDLDYLDKMAEHYGKQPSDGWVIGYDEWVMVSAAARRAVRMSQGRYAKSVTAGQAKMSEQIEALIVERDKLTWERDQAITNMGREFKDAQSAIGVLKAERDKLKGEVDALAAKVDAALSRTSEDAK